MFKVRGKIFAISRLDDERLGVMIEDSYDLIVSALPRRVREQLGGSPDR